MAKLIVLEGIDGSGKTTVAKQLKKRLGNEACFISKKSIDANTIFQKQFMTEINPILWGRKADEAIHEIDEETWLYLHILWYHMLQEYVVVPKLKEYKYVVMDGWFYKFLARHYVNNKMEYDVADYLTKRLLTPDHIFLLNASPELCYNRKTNIKTSECGIHEDKSSTEVSFLRFCKYQDKVYAAYLKIFENFKVTIINAEQEINSIVRTVMLEVKNNDTYKT